MAFSWPVGRLSCTAKGAARGFLLECPQFERCRHEIPPCAGKGRNEKSGTEPVSRTFLVDSDNFHHCWLCFRNDLGDGIRPRGGAAVEAPIETNLSFASSFRLYGSLSIQYPAYVSTITATRILTEITRVLFRERDAEG